jgi:hypothetical protein
MSEAFGHEHFDAMTCPNSVTWTNDIAKLFTSVDVAHMKQVTNNQLDLSSYQSTKVFASVIYTRVANGSMPPPGSGESPWTPDMVSLFGCWIKQGCPQ